jgi:hypothetical protein
VWTIGTFVALAFISLPGLSARFSTMAWRSDFIG